MQQPIARLGRPVPSDGDMQMESHDGIKIWFEAEVQAKHPNIPITIDYKRFLLFNRLVVENARVEKTSF